MQYAKVGSKRMQLLNATEIKANIDHTVTRTTRLSQSKAKVKCEWPPPRTRFTISFRIQMRTNVVLVILALLLFLVRFTQGQGPGPQAAGLSMRSREADMRFQFEIEEGQPPGTVVGTIPTKPNFTYRFNERPPEFLLNGSTGVITTAMEIDREELSSERFDLVILSSQPTYPLEVRIVILDINDNSPYFPEPSIEVSFSESANIGTRVILDTATDGDVGVNDVTTDYKIVSGNDEGKFRLVVTTNPSGETPYLHLETTGRLDREIKSFYQLNISAQDGGTPPRYGYLLVNITVLDVNDNPPIFDHSDYSVSLNESVPPGTSVLQVRGTDNDIGDNAKITYFLRDTESQFTIDPQTGVISTLEVLKCEQNCPTQDKCPKSCVFTVIARDHGFPHQDGRAYVTVTLLDANDHDPTIKFRFFPPEGVYATVDENAQNASVVAAVSVIDCDEGQNGETWVEIQGGNELGHFRLESTPSFDLVRVNGVLDREQISKYNLTITATDRGIPPRSSTAFLIIHVNDVNDHEPIFEKNEYSAVLAETVLVGTYVAGISATDEDTGVNSDIYYAIVSGNDRRWFDIDVHTGLITTSRVLNREDQDYVELKISARDGGPNPRWTYTYLRIQILDENDEAPSFAEPLMNVTLIESAPPNSLVAVVTAVDNDLGTNGSVEYSFHPDVERLYPNKFFLDSTYGRLTLKQQLDREENEVYVVPIIARDEGTPSLSSTATVRIVLLDVNDNKPYFYPKQYFHTLRPSDTVGTIVARLTATDADIGKNAEVVYNLVSGGEGKFEINEITGIVKTKMHLSKREMSKYEIIVSVQNPDDRKMSDQAVIYVYVGDTQHRSIQFDHNKGYNFVIEEDMKNSEPNLGREAGRVSVSRSVRSGVKYSIINGDPEEWFQIEESLGIISTARSIDREIQSQFSLEIVAYDFLGFTQTTVNITITDLNDYPPTFEHPSGSIEVMEDWPVGHEVYLVKAYDLDMGPNGRIEYSLSAQPHNTFYIDKMAGMIYLNRPVRFEVGSQYEIVVTARDLGVPSLYSKLELTVVIKDVNDRTPVFDHASYETSLLESVPANDRFFLLRATDADCGINKQITYSITVGNDENRFGIFPDGYLYVKRPLDREKRDFYSLTVTAQDNGIEPRSSSVNIVIHIIDENDNNPTFDNKTFQFYIAENEPPDTYVGRLSAEDLDKGRNAELTYTITNTQSDFMINPKTGFIRTLCYFDREQLVEASGHDYLVMDAVVMDGSVTRLRDEAKIIVHVTDVNDNAPTFIRVPYHAAISEGSSIGTQVIRIAAVDLDDGINGNIQYSIVNGNAEEVFQIDDITGQIIVSKPLDREANARYILTVMARDMGEDISHNTTALVSVDVLDENDNVPRFDNATTRLINISEDAAVGSRIFTFSATDNDLGVNAEVTFLVASGNFKETFRIDGPSGSLYLARPLDYEDKHNYVLNVSATDGGTPRLSTTIQVVVEVLDVNDNAPRFSSTAVVRQIEESIPPNTPVVTLTAQDRDSGVNGKILFNISHQEPPGNHFAMQAETGVLYTTKSIDREYSDTFRLTVVATDQAEDPSMRLSVEKTVTIIVEDINDNAPTFVSMDAGVLPGGIEKGYKIMTLSASDPDANNNGMVTYELEGGDSALFSLDRLTGDLYTSRAIDRPAVTYTLTVKATDQAVVSVRKSSRNKVTIIGTLRNSDGPVFGSAEYTGSVLENKPVGTSVLSVRAQYPHGQTEKQVEYFLTAVTNAAGVPQSRVFAINRFSGVISTASVLDREGGARMFHLDVYAVDTVAQSPKTSKAKVTITVTDSNDSPPVFDSNPYKVSLSENAIAGHTVITVSASDPDTEGSLTYTLVDEKQDDKFRLDPLTGALYLSQPLDRETQDIHKIRIRADDGAQFSETILTIEVTDSNDNSPVFDHAVYSFDIPEGTQRGAQAGLVSATDADVGVNKQISYLVLSDWGNDVFSLNPQSGIFTLTSHLDYEQMQHYIFVVQAQDSGNPSLSSTVTVYFNVVDLNDNAPLFDPMSYSDEVFENITVGTSILRVSATDMDSGDNGCIIYNIIDGNTDNKFAIDTDGTIFTTKMLDRETQSFYSLTVSATDRAISPEKRLSSTVQVSVILKDVNDMAPEFVTPNETSVTENVPSNTVIMAIKAIDKDEGRNSYIEYSLSSDSHSKFSLGPIDGLLRATGPLDREQKSEYKVTVVAKDRGHPPQSTAQEITIHIMDENDNTPAFLHRQYSASVSENTSVGLSVLQVFASDVDEGLNGQLRYSIIAGDLNHDFVMDQDTGIIRVSKNLDYERKSHYSLTIQAEDSGVDIRHDTASVTIAVTDVNDNPPTFHDSPYFVHVMENAQSLPVSLMLVMAYDSDQIPNNQLQYLIKDGNRSVFSINGNTGELSVQKTLDREQQSEYMLTVICIDSGSPRQTGTGTIKIVVDDINDNQPQFAFEEYSTSIMENLPPLSPVITITASDKDTGRNAQIRYSLLGDHGGKFEVDIDTGTISTSAILDREEREVYNVLLVAEDSGLITQHRAVTNVTITVEDENDNKPEFAESSYTVYTPDNAVGGHFVFGAVAVDLDAGLNSRLVYHLSGTDADKFQINQDTGVVKLVQKLVNKSEGYQLEIHATDSGQIPLSSTTMVNVYTQRYQLFPRFHPGLRSFKFAESSENLLVTRVSATSPKVNEAGKLMYYIAGGNSGNAFSVNPEMGEVRLIGGLNRETISAYELWLEARDSDIPSLASAVKLEILVTDVNDNAPVFEKPIYNATVKEELEPPLFVIHVQAFDADYGVNGNVEYRLDGDDDVNLPFSLDAKTGKIHTTEVLDREAKDQYRIIIKAVDHGTPQKTSSATVYIKVLDKNDNPPRFTRLFSANVTENAPIGTFIIQVTSSDKDINMNANATYSFTENPGGKFHIDPVSGNVTVAGWLDREVKDEYLLKVAAVDGSWQAETPLTVLIQDVNDNVPEFSLPEYTFNIPELIQGVSFIGQVSATDRDKKGPDSFVSYSLKRPSDLFRIDPSSGNILSKQVLYYKRTLKGSSSENRHVIQVVATDHGNPPLSSEVTVLINVIDSNNNAPVFQKEFYFSPIPESAAIGLSVLRVIAEDKEDVGINAEIEYQKTGGNGTEYFSVHKKTGWVTVSSPLIGLKLKWFAINIKATDKGVPPRSSEVATVFAVTEENRFAPAFTALSYQVVIPENEPLLSEIVTVTATDEDKGFNGEILYSILSGNHDGQFEISPHTGAITIAKHLDFESVTTYHLDIMASDRGFRSKNSTAVLTVLVTDVNDNPPIFNSSKFDAYITENQPPGTYVTQLIAFDADSVRNSIIEYSIMEGDDHSFFEISSKTGVITSKVVFDYEQKTKYAIQVITSNVGTLLFTSAVVDIHIVGKNEYYPHFVQPVFQFTVSESARVGTVVGQLQVIDEDSGVDGEVYFLLVGSSNNKGFQIDTRTGSIKVSRALDRESQSRVVLTVLAKNAGSIRGNDTDEAQLVISIQDGNDPPVFSKEIYEARVSEAAPLGTSVVSVSAVDKDVHPSNNQFSFSILSGNVNKVFSIDPQSGAIYLSGNLDRETIAVYNLTVTATDSGNPPQSGSTQVKIYIDDVNDNGPIFETPKVIGYVLENEPPYTSVMVLSVTDRDLPPNGAPFMFYLVGGEHKDFFEIESHTGLVKTTRSLDRESISELEFIVEIQDSGKPPMSSQSPVTVMVLDKNDSPSTSRPLLILVWVHNKNFPGGKIADVHPQDLDNVGQYQCQILEGNSAIFRIPRKCDLHTTKIQNPGSYALTVSGNDGKHHNVSSTIKVKFLNFDNDTLQNSVSLRIWNLSADAFLATHFESFRRALDEVFKPTSQPVIYSIVNIEEHLEITLASKSPENFYVPSQDILTLLSDKLPVIRQSIQDEEIVIGFNPCEISPCQNKGSCSSFLEMKDILSIVDSSTLIFTSPYVARQFSCQCPRGFSGSVCQYQQDPCLPNPCLSGGTCHQDGITFRCTCTPQYQGEKCDTPRKESCSSAPCRNGGTCQEAPNGGFFCLCRPGFKGLVCEQTADACRPNRCLNGGTCVSENLGYHCVCTSSYFGRHCEKSSYGFLPYSYMAFNSLQPTTNDISVIFSTNNPNALLVYNFGAQSGGRSDFLALEIINSIPTLSFGGSRTAITRISVNIVVSDGKWHKVTVIRNGKVASVSVVNCSDNGDTCEECLLGNSTCSKSATGHTGTLNFNGNLLFVGGVATVDPLLERPGEVSSNDFVGCLRGLSVNGRQIDMSSPLKSAFVSSTCSRKEGPCSASTCGDGATCIDNWFSTSCLCDFKMLAASCTEAKKPYSIGNGAFIELIPQEKHRRTLLLTDRMKDSAPKTLSFLFRSFSQNGVIMHSGTDDERTLLQLIKGKLVYSSKIKSSEQVVEELELPRLNDGHWHKLSLAYHPGKYPQVNISIENAWQVVNSKQLLHDFLDPYLSSITIGGQWEHLSGDGQYNDISGCIKMVAVNNEVQLQNSTGYFQLYLHGNSHSLCQSEAIGIDNATPTDPLSIGVILVIVFFIILLIVILISFLVFRRRKLKRDKSSGQVKQNGNAFLTSATGDPHRVHQCGGYTETSGGDDVMRNHMPQDLVPKKLKDRDPHKTDCPQRPDIIEREIHNKPSPALRMEDPPPHSQDKAQNNFVMQNPADLEPPEHYDLENASSIAPSDIDIVYHYKGFRDGNIHKYKPNPQVPSYHKHNHRHSPHQFQSNPVRESPRNILHQPHNPLTQRESPSSIKMQNTPLARLSPSSELSQQTPRILTLQDISGKPLQKALLATAQGVGSKQFQNPMTNSDRSLNSPVSNLSHSTSSMQSGPQNVSKLKARDNSITLGLTTEEIERLNARPRNLSLVSTLDAVSSSSDDNAEKHKLAELLESNTELLEAQDSSTDESGNDSFTCSEFEYDNYDKVHREFGPRNMIFSKLAEEDNENDEDYAKNYDGFDSFRGSFSTLVASDDESSNPPPYKPTNGSMLGWDCLLNWGPNFENLVGVFKDIEQLPDNVNSSGPGHSQTDEDYV